MSQLFDIAYYKKSKEAILWQKLSGFRIWKKKFSMSNDTLTWMFEKIIWGVKFGAEVWIILARQFFSLGWK